MKNIHKEIVEELNVKGGGNPQTVQGACSKDELDIVLEKFYEKILNSL